MYLKPPPSSDGYTRTLADEVVDAYGITTPLLSFHEIKSRCQTDGQIDVSPPPPNSNENENDPQGWKPVIKPKDKIEITTEGKPILGSHPYIITRYIHLTTHVEVSHCISSFRRTHLNIMDMTKLYKREAFEAAHRRLSMIDVELNLLLTVTLSLNGSRMQCGERSHNGFRSPEFPPDWRLCHRSFYANGNCEVMIEYPPDEERSNSSSTMVYAPYLFVDPIAWGALVSRT